VETGQWDKVDAIPVVVPSRDFEAVKLQWSAKSAAVRKDPRAAQAAAAKLVSLSKEPDRDPFAKSISSHFAKSIIGLQAKEAEAFAAEALGDADRAVSKLKEAAAIEDAIIDLSQPPYPAIPANELCGNLLLELNRPAEAVAYFQRTLTRTPGRPKAIFGLARAAQALGDEEAAANRYQEFLSMWKTADPGLPELVLAKEFIAGQQR
jgi:tetratricopeptide (TPR) repeat protein